ncbi:MAG: 3-hydroxyacyl-CoA dehydrogenase NAD-binding domain-containing protein, partial [Gemmatimonadota bacterium]|nr:3-hydroxyacyl-CoA dehydrogenase NAD-binding domain-containing protein [Gemmatimonadota bacterium]
MEERIVVVGAGQMGNGIAHVFAQSGYPVTMIDVSREALERGQATIRKNLDRQVKKGTISAEASTETLGRVELSEKLESAKAATLIVEAATENKDLKYRIFGDLDRIAGPQAILASNTSSISITEIARHTG